MRLGYLLADPRLVTELIKVKLPYNLGHASVIAGRVALEAEAEARRRVRLLVARRPQWAAMLGEEGFEVFPSEANFLLVRCAPPEQAKEIREMLEARSIRVRDVSGYPGLAGCLRVSVGTGASLRAVRAALRGEPSPPGPLSRSSRPPSPGEGRSDGSGRSSARPARPASGCSSHLDGGERRIDVPNGFFAHMLTALATHAGFGIDLEAEGDTHVDLHHTVEDVGIALGEALAAALGERRGIVRFAHAYAPLDEALARAVVDLSGRGTFHYSAPPEVAGRLGDGGLPAHPGRRLLSGVRGPRTADAPSRHPRRPQRPPRRRGRLQGRGAGAAAGGGAARRAPPDVPSTKGTLSA